MTPAEFDATSPEEFVPGYRYEVINGVLIVSPPPGAGERSPNDYLGFLLTQYREQHALGSALDGTLPEQTIPASHRRRADRAIWVGLGRQPNELEDIPAIVVEFVSERRRDRVRDLEMKRDEYLAAGVREYWVIDRFRRVITVYQKEPASSQPRMTEEGESYRTDLLPGFQLPLRKLFEESDRWNPRDPGKAIQQKTTRKPNPPAGGTDG